MNPFRAWEKQARLCALADAPILVIDNDWGPASKQALKEALMMHGGSRFEDLVDPIGITRIHQHWTAGSYGVTEFEKGHYNFLTTAKKMVVGRFPLEAQATYEPGRAASHTWNANSHAGGASMDAMADAVEVPFNPGSSPLTWRIVINHTSLLATICMTYWLPPNKWTLPTHAEIQDLFGVRQREKWDVIWLPDMERPGSAEEVGERLRDMVKAQMGLLGDTTLDDLLPDGALAA